MKRILIVCSVVAAVAALRISSERLQDLQSRFGEIKSQLHDGLNETRSKRLKDIYKNIPLSDARLGENSFLCGMCYSVVEDFFWIRRNRQESDEFMKSLAIALCVDLEIQSEEVCHGIVEFNAPSILFIIDNRADLKADTVCKLLLNDGDCINPSNDDNLEFSVEISDRKSESPNQFLGNDNRHNGLTIIHITDIHYDPKYKPGAFADCDEYACCREIDDINENDPGSTAGRWGDYRSCDTPWCAIVNALHQITKQHSKIDAIYFTGDIVDHFMWDASVTDMKYEIGDVYKLMREVFGNIPMYPILGNHEPQNIFAPIDIDEPSISTKWLYEHVSEIWKHNLPPCALETVRNGGYYTTLIRPGLRLIALNNNVCFTINWWIIYSVKSIASQFQWLHDVLLSAEKAGEKVHILAHIPNGDEDYHQPCSREFNRIVNRFHETIAAQFNGHIEVFGFNVFYSKTEENLPVNVAWNGGSIATFSGVNRNYNVYNVDPVTYQVTDVESWIYNLTAANQHELQDPFWFRQFTLRDAFNLADLSPSTINEFVNTLPGNTTAIQQLWKMKVRDSDLMLKKGCDKSCLEETLCEILITDNTDLERCERVKQKVKGR